MTKQKTTRSGKNTQRAFLLGASALATSMGLAVPEPAWASTCGSFSTTSTIGSAAFCTAFTWTGTLGGTVTNNGTLVANNTGISSNYAGFSIQGGKTLTAFINNNSIGGTGTVGGLAAIVITGAPTFTTTSGTITYGIGAYTTIGTFQNNAAGMIRSDGSNGAIRIRDGVLMGEFTNSGTILASGNSAINLTGGSIGTLTNSGYIYSSVGGAIDVDVITTISTIGTLINSGTLRGNSSGTGAVNVFGVVGSVNNSGTIINDSGPGVVVRNYGGFGPTAIYHSHVGTDGTLSTLTNSGLITGAIGVSIGAGGSIANLTNTSTGTIQGGIVIAQTSGNASVTHNGYLGVLANAGVIVGNIVNAGSNVLTITGDTGGGRGTITGASGKGSITNTLANLVLSGGSLLLNDNINVGTNTLISRGTDLTIAANSTITGNYYHTLSSNTLTTSGLTVTGRVTLVGGTIVPSFSGTSNYVVGTAASLMYSPTGIVNLGAAFATVQAPTGAHFSNIGASGTTLIYYNPLMDYVGGSLASLTVGSTILNGTSTIYPTALYIASTGSLGSLSNTGTIRGNIINLSTNDLSINGGTLTTVGTLTGYSNSIGTITNTLSNVVLAGGNLRVNDVLNLGTGTLINNGANLTFGTLGTISLTGNFAQTSAAGTLALGTNLLSVSGAASIAGTVLSNFTTNVNHTLGEGITLISAAGGLTLGYGTLTGVVSTSGTGINVIGTTSGNDLLAMVQNYYIAGTYGTVTNTGTLTAASAVYVASTGTLGAVSNSGIIQGNIVNNSVRDLTLLGAGGTDFGTFTGLSGGTAVGTITNTASNVTVSGNVLLNDSVNVAGHTLVADGATVRLNQPMAITGNYSQTGGQLLELSAVTGGELVVSGAASISGVNYSVVGASSLINLLQGPAGGTPIIAGGVGSSYTSITYNSGITGLTLGGYTQGTSLWGTVLNDYIGGSYALRTVGSGTVLSSPGVQTLIYIAGTGTLGTLSNSGTIQGNIVNNGSGDLNIQGGTGGTVGTFAGAGGSIGTITNTLSNVRISAGNVLLNDVVNVGGGTVSNTGADLMAGTNATIQGNFAQNTLTGTLSIAPGGKLVVTGAASITDGVINAQAFDARANHIVGDSIVLVEAGVGSTFVSQNSASQPLVRSGIDGLVVSSSVSANTLSAAVLNDYIGASTGVFTNSASIVIPTLSNVSAALYVAASGTVGTLTNTGTLNAEAAGGFGIRVSSANTLGSGGSIANLTNSGVIAGRQGIYNGGTIGIIDNTGQILDSLPNSGIVNLDTINQINNQAAGTIAGARGVTNSGAIGAISNFGLIQGSISSGTTSAQGISNSGTLGTISNSGTIRGTSGTLATGVTNDGLISTLVNNASGIISGQGALVSSPGSVVAGVNNQGTITGLSNAGTITGNYGVFNVGTIGMLANSGLLSGATALYNSAIGSLGSLSNSGTISGNITNLSSRDLSISGGAGAVVGTLTGGTISNTASNVVLASGNLLLNDAVNVGGGTLVNSGASVLLQSIVSVTGNYAQSAGTLAVGIGGASAGELRVSGDAALSGGMVAVTALTGANLLAGQSYTIVEANGSLTTGGLAASASGFSVATSIINNGANKDLLLTLLSDYVSGSLGTLSNTGSLSAATAVNITSSGSLGTLVNTGTIAGNIVNLSATDLSISGGTGAVFGTLTGGTISNTLSNVVLASGNLLLNDTVNVGGGTLVNSGASVLLQSIVSVTGNYGQSAGTLNVNGNSLQVSGSASISGGTVVAGLSSTDNYLVGDSATLVSGGAGSSYGGASVGSGVTGLSVTGVTSGNALVAVAGNDYVGGTLAGISNTGTLSAVTALYIASTGSLGSLSNSGTISGNITNLSSRDLSISGGAGAVFGTLTGGTISNTASNVVLASGNLLLNDAVNVGGGTLVNSGASVLLQSIVSVTGNYGQSAGTLNVGGNSLQVSGSASISGGTVVAGLSSTDNYLVGDSATLVSGGAGSSYGGASVGSGVTGLSVTGVTSGNALVAVAGNDYVGGTLAGISNTGTLSAVTALYIASTGSLGSLSNSGTIAGNITNLSSRDLSISGGAGAVVGTLTGGTISNTASNVVLASGNLLLNDAVNVGGGTLVNSGASVLLQSIVNVTGNYGQSAGTLNVNGNILQVSGSASIGGGTVVAGLSSTGNYLAGDSTTLVSGGAGSSYGGASVGSGVTGLSVTGATSGNALVAVAGNDYVGGTLSGISNTGTLSAVTALYIASTGSLGSLSNSGTISGNITNLSSRDLSISGGAGAVVGTLTGGTISNTASNVVLASGNLLLNDAVNVGGGTLVNSGASVLLQSIVNVTGNYGQSAGTLNVNGNSLQVSGSASISGGTVVAGLSSTGNYLAGDSTTLVSGGAGSSYGGASVGSGVTGLSVTGVTSGNALVAVAGNDYVGGTLAGISNTGTLSAVTALYIASTGSLGSLSNSGTISGNITNLSSRDLSISGGAGAVVGTLTGGTISNTASNVVLASGNLLLNDAVNVGGGTLVNSGASVLLQSIVNVTGNYGQSAGTLNVNGNILQVSGSASISGGTVVAGLSSTDNYLVGDSATLVSGGAGSSYGGASVGSGVTGLSVTGATSGNALVAVAGNDYVGGTLSGISNTGTLSAATALYIASTGSLGSLSNSGTIAGNITNLSSRDLIISGGTDAAPGVITGIGGAQGTISNSFANLRFTSGTLLVNSGLNVGGHSVVNSGATLQVNNQINITGSYTQTAGGLVIGVSSASNYGSLVISGTANLSGGGITLKDLTSTALAAGESFTIVQAGGGLSLGNLSLTASGYTVTASTITSGGFSDLVLSLSRGSTQTVTSNYTAVGVATGGAAVGTGAALDKLVTLASTTTPGSNPTVAAFQTAVLAPLAKLSASAQQVAVTQLSPSQLTPQLTAVAVTPTTTAITQHQQTVASLMDSGGPGAAAGSEGQKGAVWGEVIGGGALRGTTPEAAGYRASTTGLVVGGDWYASPELAAGVAFSWLDSASVGQGPMAGSLTRVSSYQVTAYGTWRPDWADERLAVDGQLGFGYNQFDQRREISFLHARANANYGGEQYLGKVTVGYDLPVQSWLTLTPEWSLRLAHLSNDAYSERDAGAANLQVGGLDTDSLTQELGLKLNARLDTWLGKLEPDLRFAWVHDYLNGPIATTGVMAGVSFASTTGRPNADGLALGLGATLHQSDEVSLRLEYDGELRQDYQSHTGVLRATFRF